MKRFYNLGTWVPLILCCDNYFPIKTEVDSFVCILIFTLWLLIMTKCHLLSVVCWYY